MPVRVVGIEIGPGAPAAVLPPLLRTDGLENLQEPIGVGNSSDGDDHYLLRPIVSGRKRRSFNAGTDMPGEGRVANRANPPNFRTRSGG
jgi:hypothetical protein